MELKHIKELMAAMGRTGIERLSYKKEGEYELLLEKGKLENGRHLGDQIPDYYDEQFKQPYSSGKANEALSRGGDLPVRATASNMELPKEEANAIYITSPMVGTFYATPSPEDPPFVKVGDKIDKNNVVCVIEAMKVMNEIKANLTGTIAEVLVESGHPVEFGTKLFRIL